MLYDFLKKDLCFVYFVLFKTVNFTMSDFLEQKIIFLLGSLDNKQKTTENVPKKFLISILSERFILTNIHSLPSIFLRSPPKYLR